MLFSLSLGARPATAAARNSAGALLAAAALLACASPAAGQDRAPIVAPTGACDSIAFHHAYLRNAAEVERQGAAIYPAELRRFGVRQGHAILQIRVLPDGTVDPDSFSVEQASHREFEEVAGKIIPAMRFAPVRVQGAPVAAWLTHRVEFLDPENQPDEGTYELTPSDLPTLLNGAEVMRDLAAQHPGVRGAALVELRVDADSSVDSSSVRVDMVTDRALEQPAMAAARRMRFVPAKLDTRPVSVTISLPIIFGAEASCRAPRASRAVPSAGAPPAGS